MSSSFHFPGKWRWLYVTIVFCTVLAFACREQTQHAQKENKQNGFAGLRIHRYSLPIMRLKQLQNNKLTLDKYLDSLNFYVSTLATLSMDTITPLAEKKRQSIRLHTEKDYLCAEARVNELLATCGNIFGNCIDVEAYTGNLGIPATFVSQYSKPVGFIVWNTQFNPRFYAPNCSPGEVLGKPRGTGCLIGPDLFLTALHCFQAVAGGDLQYPFIDYDFPKQEELATMMHVTFNYQYVGKSNKLHTDTTSFSIQKLVEFNDTLDYAIVRLAPAKDGHRPGDSLGWLKPIPRSLRNDKEKICVIQQYPLNAKQVGIGNIDTFDNIHITYSTIDTDDGCSGSPVIRYPTGELEGMHIEGSCTRSQKDSNIAVKMQAILARSPLLAQTTSTAIARHIHIQHASPSHSLHHN